MAQQRRGGNEWILGGVAAVVLAAVVAWFVFGDSLKRLAADPDGPSDETTAAAQVSAAPSGDQEMHYPVPPPADASADGSAGDSADSGVKPLPPLEHSDEELSADINKTFGPTPLESFLVPKDIIRRIVVTIDNLPTDSLSMRYRAVPRTPGNVDVQPTDQDGVWILNTAAETRYDAFVQLVDHLDADTLVTFYFHYYPLFQQAYAELGYGNRQFNDRVVAVIDHLLAGPAVEAPIKVIRPGAFYQFQDAELESQSSGRKILIRMGNERAAALKRKLVEIREAIVTRTGAVPAN